MIEALDILRHYLKARYLQRFKTRAALEQWQARALGAFRQEFLDHLPFYQAHASRPFQALPRIDKEIMSRNFEGMNSLGLSHETALDRAREAAGTGQSAQIEDVTIGMSSGTSGNRGVFLVSAKERRKWLGTILAKALPGGLFRRHRVALLLAADSRLYQTANRSKQLQLSFLSLKDPIEDHLLSLQKFQPTLLIAPAHVLRLLAEQQRIGLLQIKPERVFSAAETLSPEMAKEIADQWGAPVHQFYQSTEGFIGATCEYGTLHLNEDFLLVEKEWIDRERRAFNPVITDFSRRVQAMVRYQMNDILVERESPCPCGSPLLAIERIEGRMDDLLIVGNSLFFPDELRAVLLDSAPSCRDFRLCQTGEHEFSLALDGQGIERAIIALKALIEDRSGQAIEIHASPFPTEIDHCLKMRRIRREFPID